MKKIVRSFLINIIILYLATRLIGGFHINLEPATFLLVSAVYSLVHMIIRPIAFLLLGPINFITLGLFGFVIDAALLFGVAYFMPAVSITPWDFPGMDLGIIALAPMALSYWAVLVVAAVFLNFFRSSIMALCD